MGVSGGFEGLQARGTFRWSPDGESIAYTYMGPKMTSDIWVISADGGELRQLTDHMPEGLRTDPFVEPELISYESEDGLEVPAFLYLPEAGPGTFLPCSYTRGPTLTVCMSTGSTPTSSTSSRKATSCLRPRSAVAPETDGSTSG